MTRQTPIRTILKPARKIARSADQLIRLGWYDLWTAEGDAGNGLRTIAYAGSKAFKNHFFRVFFKNAFFEHAWGRTPYWQAEGRLAKNHRTPSLVVHEVNERRARFFNLPGEARIPVWLRVEYDFVGEKSDPATSPLLADMRRRIRKQGFEADYSWTREDLNEFYERMYVPYAKKRYGTSGVVLAAETLEKKLENADIVKIVKDGEWVAAGFIDYSGDEPHLSSLGVRDGDEAWRKLGAIDAAYYFSLVRMRSKGHKTVSLGNVRPFMDDGTLRYKLHLGARLAPSHLAEAGYLNVKINGRSGRELLAGHPFVSLEDNKYILTAYSPTPADPQLLEELRRIPAPGIDIRILPV